MPLNKSMLTVIDNLLDAALVVDEVLALLPLLLAVRSQDGLGPNVRRFAPSATTTDSIEHLNL